MVFHSEKKKYIAYKPTLVLTDIPHLLEMTHLKAYLRKTLIKWLISFISKLCYKYLKL